MTLRKVDSLDHIPAFDLGDALLSEYQKPKFPSPNFIEKPPYIEDNYFVPIKCPTPEKERKKTILDRPISPQTTQGTKETDSIGKKAINFITEEMKKDRQIGINIAEVKPMIKNWAMRCVLL